MKPNELLARLRKKLSPVYVLCGPEAFLREEAERAVRSHAGLRPPKGSGPQADESEEIILWTSEGASLREAVEEALTRPLFARRKFVVLREADEELKRNAGVLESYLRSPPEFSTLVIECSGAKAPKLKGAALVECQRLYETEYARPGVSAQSPLGRWLRARASKMRVELTAEATVCLIEAVGTDLHELASAVELLATNLERKRVGGVEIEEFFPRSRTSPAYRLVDAVLDGRSELAMELAREAFESGVEVSGGRLVRGDGAAAAMLLAVLARELERLQLACSMLEEGEKRGAVLKELGVPRHREEAFIGRARRARPEASALALEALMEAETAFKTGASEPRLAVLTAVARIGEVWKDVRDGVRQGG